MGVGATVDEDDEQSHRIEARRSARAQRALVDGPVDLCSRIVSFLLRKRPTRNHSELIPFVELTAPDTIAIVASLDGAASRVAP